MDELDELYQEIILDHNKRPRGRGELPGATHTAQGDNPLCGDEIRVFVRLEGDKIADVKFIGEGCAISKASASLMTQAVRGKTVAQATEQIQKIHDMFTGQGCCEHTSFDTDGEIAALGGVKKFPQRVKCATLAWHALDAALDGKPNVSTE